MTKQYVSTKHAMRLQKHTDSYHGIEELVGELPSLSNITPANLSALIGSVTELQQQTVDEITQSGTS